jgi:hypothetical protein
MRVLLAVIFLIMAMPFPAMAEDKPLNITFDYPEIPITNVRQPEKFILYKGLESVCIEEDEALRSFPCDVMFTSADVVGQKVVADFSLTAVDNFGVESEHSNIFPVEIDVASIDPLPAPLLMNVVVGP